MSIKLQKENIKLNEVLCTRYGQTMVESDLIVPDIKPDISKVLQISGEVSITQKNIQQDKVYVQGTLKLNILYIPEGNVIGNIKSMSASQGFSHLIDAKGAKPGMTLNVEAEPEHINHSLINSRKINVRSKIGLNIKISVPSEIQIATDMDGDDDIQLKCFKMRMSSCTDTEEREFVIREQLEIPTGKPSIGEVLKICAKPSISNIIMMEEKVKIEGKIKVCTLYCGDDEENSIQFMEHETPFSETLDISGVNEYMEGDVEICVKDLYHEIREDNDGDNRILGVEILLLACVKGTEIMDVNAIEDAYALKGEIEMVKKAHNIEQLIDLLTSQLTHKENVQIPDHMQNVAQIFDCSSNAHVENITIDDGKLTLSGSILTNILYLTPDPQMPISSFDQMSMFEHVIDFPNLDSTSACDAKVDIEHVGYALTSERDIELRFVIGVSVKAFKSGLTEVVDEILLSEESEPKKIPSIVLYFTQRGDTLWDIAKRYKTTPDAIIANNKLDSDHLNIGQQIKIFKQA